MTQGVENPRCFWTLVFACVLIIYELWPVMTLFLWYICPKFQDTLNLSKVTYAHYSGQFIAMSHEVTPKGSLVRELPLFEGNPGLVSLKLKVPQAFPIISWKGQWRTTWDTLDIMGYPSDHIEPTGEQHVFLLLDSKSFRRALQKDWQRRRILSVMSQLKYHEEDVWQSRRFNLHRVAWGEGNKS